MRHVSQYSASSKKGIRARQRVGIILEVESGESLQYL
jgi:hypothetical protein